MSMSTIQESPASRHPLILVRCLSVPFHVIVDVGVRGHVGGAEGGAVSEYPAPKAGKQEGGVRR